MNEGHIQPLVKAFETKMRLYENRLNVLEAHEKLTSRALIEKRGALKVNGSYSLVPADTETYRRAVISLGLAIKVIEKDVTFKSQPFNFLVEVALESNKMAQTFNLSMNQQTNGFLTFVPSSSKEYTLLTLCDDLSGIFDVISTYSTSMMTQSELEIKINSWKLDTSTLDHLIYSTTTLIDLYRKNAPYISSAELITMVTARIQSDRSLPPYISTLLTEFRLKIRPDDKMQTLSGMLLACIKRCVKQHPKDHLQPQSKNIPPKQVKSLQQVVPQPQPSVPATVKAIKSPVVMSSFVNNGNKNKPQPQPSTQGQTALQQITTPHGTFTWDNTRTYRPNNFGRTFVRPFVDPHPNPKGTKISKAFESHFLSDCFRCGDSSHKSSDCKLYPERVTVVTVCSTCGQGLHEVCRSKRRDLIKKAAKNNSQTGGYTNKQIFDMFQYIKNNVQYRPEHESDSE
jgi:hypothetical protein